MTTKILESEEAVKKMLAHLFLCVAHGKPDSAGDAAEAVFHSHEALRAERDALLAKIAATETHEHIELGGEG